MKIKSFVLASSVLLSTSGFAATQATPVNPGVGNQEISITNNLTVSGIPTSTQVVLSSIMSKHEYPNNGDVTCTLNGGGENLCYDLSKVEGNGVSIPYGQTLTITLYPWAKGSLPGETQWHYGYTQQFTGGLCEVESTSYDSDPTGSMNPENISKTVDINSFLGGSAFCHKKA